MDISYTIIERKFEDLKKEGVMGLSLEIRGSRVNVIIKRQRYGEEIMFDFYINDELILSNVILGVYDGLVRRKHANKLFPYDFTVVPINENMFENTKVTVESLGTQHYLAYSLYEEE